MSYHCRSLAGTVVLLVCALFSMAIGGENDSTPTPLATPRPPYDALNPPPGVSPEQARSALRKPEEIHIHDWERDEGWSFFREKKGVKIYTRIREDSKIKEGVGVGWFEANPCRVVQVLTDNPRVPDYMPYVRVSLVKQHTFNEEYFCQYLALPWPLADRKYNLYGARYNISADGNCSFLLTWKKDNTTLPCSEGDLRKHVDKYKQKSIFTEENEGYWHLVGRDNNTRTWAAYYVYTDPGGKIPPGIQNFFVDDAISSVFEGGREQLKVEGLYPPCDCGPTEIP
jgi:hypothetical protein